MNSAIPDEAVSAVFGVPILVTRDMPKRFLALDVPVRPEFRAEIDAWMVEFFGTWNVFEDGAYFVEKHPNGIAKLIHMNPRTFEMFKREIESTVRAEVAIHQAQQ